MFNANSPHFHATAGQVSPGLAELHAKCDAQNDGDLAALPDGKYGDWSAAPDFRFANHGSVSILTPLSEAARIWVDEHIAEYQSWAGGVAMEARYAPPIIEALVEDGYEFEA